MQMNSTKLLILGFLITLLGGCASSSNIEATGNAAIADDMSIETITVSNNTGETFDGTDVVSMMRDAAREQATKYGLTSFGSASAYELEINIIQYSKGNAVARWMLPGAGKTILSVEAKLNDANGITVAESQATESIGAGGLYTIGAWKRVFDKVAKSLVGDIAELTGRSEKAQSSASSSRLNKRELLRVQGTP